MVLTRSKKPKKFIRLPRYGRITLYKKMQLEEMKNVTQRTTRDNSKRMEIEEPAQDSLTFIDDISDALSTTSEATVCSDVTVGTISEERFTTPKKTRPTSDGSYSPIQVTEKNQKRSEYEEQRLERMKENMKVLQGLGISNVFGIHKNMHVKNSAKKKILNKKRKQDLKRKRMLQFRIRNNASKVRRKSPRFCKTASQTMKVDRESQLDFDIDAIASMMKSSISKEGLSNKYFGIAEESCSDQDTALSTMENLIEEDEREIEFINSLEDKYYTCEEYFTLKGIKPKLIQENGCFTGWVEEQLRNTIGIAMDKESAWLQNGGKYSIKNISTPNKPFRQSAKETARTMLFKNPNSYFYRHTAPGIDHWQGDWTERENKKFLGIAKKYGVGNKWGLFATYIENRVGYQCSNHYRAHFVEGGIIWDGNFMLDKYGKSIYVGRKNRFV